MNINNFMSMISQYGGVDQTNEFEVIITPPLSLAGTTASEMRFFIDSANLPGISFQTSEISQHGYGPMDRRPSNSLYEEMQMTILADAKGRNIKYLHDWVNTISSFSNSDGRFKFEFPDEYSTLLEIRKYDAGGNNTYKWKLFDAFPTTINSVGVQWDSENEITKYPVSFSYRYWEHEKVE